MRCGRASTCRAPTPPPPRPVTSTPHRRPRPQHQDLSRCEGSSCRRLWEIFHGKLRVSFVVVWVHAALSTLRSTTTLRAPNRQLELVNNTTMGGTRLCTSHLATQVPLLYNVQEHSRSNGRPYFSVERTEIYCLTVPPHL